jgi:hypothetical protein
LVLPSRAGMVSWYHKLVASRNSSTSPSFTRGSLPFASLCSSRATASIQQRIPSPKWGSSSFPMSKNATQRSVLQPWGHRYPAECPFDLGPYSPAEQLNWSILPLNQFVCPMYSTSGAFG